MPTEPSPQPEPRPSNGAFAAWGTVILVAATVLLGALAPARHGGPGAAPTRTAEEAGCLEWTDGCRVCRRLAEGPACSTPGIACLPGAVRCLRPGG